MRCEEPVKILEIKADRARLLSKGNTKSVKCGKSTVGEIQKRCRNCKLPENTGTG